MKSIKEFDYPKILQNIFDKLKNNEIRAIIVGGYIRDFFLNIQSKDIDIELYGVDSFEALEKILQEFGEVNSVGKSFGVCKLSLKEFEIDFTLPRTDSKISTGHKGFEVTLEKNLDFSTATSRRDFTINAIGFDTKDKTILDPFNGIDDIKNKILKAVNIQTFGEDPLRVLRAAQFHSRLHFSIDKELSLLCKKMCDENILSELAPQRVYGEIQKIVLKSTQPSLGFSFLKEINALQYLAPLDSLSTKDFNNILNALDKAVSLKTNNNKTNTLLMLSILCYKFDEEKAVLFLSNLSNEKSLIKNILALKKNSFSLSYSDSELFALAVDVNIEQFLVYSYAIHNLDKKIFDTLNSRAKELDILNTKAKAFLQGRDILKYGIKPSVEFSTILNKAYEAQISLEIQSYEEAIVWLENYLRA